MKGSRFGRLAVLGAAMALAAPVAAQANEVTKWNNIATSTALAQPGITSAIIGASKPEQLEESLAAVSCTLDEREQEMCNLAWFALPRRQAER